MADTADTRIVEMQFQNKDFEKNIATSQKSLEKFKKELNFDETSKGLDNFSKSMKNLEFSTLESNIQKLTDKFTGLGNVGEFVLSRIRRTLEGMGDQVLGFVNSLTTAQTKAGFVKYESLNKSVQTLKSATGKEEKEIYGVLDRLTKYTDQTSYDFSQGVTSISQLVSSGAATLEKAETVVEGFYNYAAKAGADTQKASHALEYSMVQALQRGFLDWGNAKELNRQSLLTMDFKEQLIATAVELGTVTKEGNKYYAMSKQGKKQKKIEINATNLFNDSLQHQWATTKVVNATLAKYADTSTEFGAQAYAAAQRCTTFTDALNAWKDMLSTGWMETYRTVFGDLGESMSLFSAICDKVSGALEGLMNTRNKILDAWKEMGGRDSLMGMLFGEMEDPDGKTLFEGAYGILDIFTEIGNMISDGWRNTVKNLIPKNEQQMLLDEVNNNIDAINATLVEMNKAGLLSRPLEELLITGPFKNFDELWNSEMAKETGMMEGAFGGGLNQATQNLQKFVAGIHEWFNTVDEGSGTTRLQKIQAILNAIINTISFGIDILGGIIDFFGMIGSQLTPSFDAVTTFFAALSGGVEEGEQSIRNSGGIKKFFTTLAEILKPITGAVNAVTTSFFSLLTAIANSTDVSEGAANAWNHIKEALSKVWHVIKAVCGPIVSFITSVMDTLTGLFNNGLTPENMAEAKGKIANAFGVMFEGIRNAVTSVAKKIGALLSTLWQTISEGVSGYFADENSFGYQVVQWFRNMIANLKEKLNGIIPGMGSAIFGFFENVVAAFRTGLYKIKSLFKRYKEFGFGDTLADRFTDLFKSGLLDGFKKIGEAISKVFTGIFNGDVLSSSTEKVSGILERLKAAMTKPGSLGEGVLILFRRIKDWWLSLNSETKALVVAGVVVAALIKKIVGVFQTIADGVSDFASILKGNFGQAKAKTLSDKILKIGAGIALITASLYTLANIDLNNGGWQALIGFEAILLSIVGYMALMKMATEGMTAGDAAKMSVGVIAMASAIRRIVNALMPVTKVSRNQLETMGWALAGITGAMLLLMGIAKIGKFSWGSGGGMLLFAIAMAIMINQLEKLLGDEKNVQVLEFIKQVFHKMIELCVPIFLLGVALGKAAKGLQGAGVLAAAIAVLVFALRQVTDLNRNQLIKMGVVLAAALVALTGFIAFMGMMKNSKGLKDSDLWQLIALAAGIGGLIFVLQQVANMRWDQLGKMGAVFGGVIVGISGLIAVIGLFGRQNGRGLKKSGLASVIGLAVGILALILVLQQVANMRWEQLGKMGAVFGGVILGLVLVIKAIGKAAGENGRGFKGAGMFTGIIAIVLGVKGLIEVLSKVGKMRVGEIAKMLVTFKVIMGSLKAFIKSIGQSAGEGGRGFKGAGMLLGMISLVYGIERLIHYMIPLTKMGWGDLAKLWISLSVVFSGLKKLIKALPENVSLKASFGAVLATTTFVGSIWALIEVLKPLSGMSWGELGKMGAGFIVLAIGMKKIIKSMMEMSEQHNSDHMKGTYKMLLTMAGTVGMMVGLSYALNKVKNIKTKTILGFTLGISAMMLAMAKASKIASTASWEGVLIAIVGLVAGVAGIMAVIGLLGPWVLESIGASLIPFGEGLQALGDAIKTFSEATSGVSDANINASLNLIHGIAKVQLALTAENISLAVFSGLTGKNIDKGNLKAFGADMAAVGGFVADFCTAIKDSDFTNVEKAASALTAIAGVQHSLTIENIELAVFSALTGKDIDAGNLESFGKDILAVAPMLKTVGDTLKDTDFTNFPQAAAALNAMSDARSKLTWENIELAVFSALTGQDIDAGNLESFGKDILAVAPMLKIIGDKFKNTDFTNFGKAAEALSAIEDVRSQLTGENIELAVFSALTGKDIDAGNLESFGKDILAVAPMLQTVGDEFKNTDFTNFGKAAEALSAIADVRGKLTGQNIKLGIFKGLTGQDIKEADMTGFANDVKAIGPALSDISEALKDCDFDNVDQAAKALETFAKVQEVLNKDNIKNAFANLILKPFGAEVTPQKLKDFGNDLVPLGEAMAKFAASVTYAELQEGKIESINTDGFQTAMSAIEILGALQEKLPTTGSFFAFFTGEQQTLENFSTGIKKVGQGLRDMYTELYKISEDGSAAPNPADINNLAKILEALTSIFLYVKNYGADDFKLPKMDSFREELTNLIGISTSENADDIKQIADILNAMASAASSLRHFSSVDSVYDLIEEVMYDSRLNTWLKETGEQISQKLSDGIGDPISLEKVKNAVRNLVSSLKSSMMNDVFYDTLSLSEILFANVDDVDTAGIDEIISVMDAKVQNAGEDEEWSFRDVGFYMAAGLAAGVSSGTYLIENACRQAVARARAAAMDEAGEASPSKVFMEIGGYMSEGAAIGIQNGTEGVEKASTSMVDTAIRRATEQFGSGHFDILGSLFGINAKDNPIIMPAVDMTKITQVTESLKNQLPLWINLFGMDVKDDPIITPVVDMTNITQATESLKNQLPLWARLFGMDVNENPTITPIVDMTNIDLAAQSLDNMFGPRNLELSADGYRYARDSVPRNDKGTNEYKAPDLSSIRESISALGSRIDGVAAAVGNMQVVLNTGGLVGAVTDGVNKNLGAKTTYRRRRN